MLKLADTSLILINPSPSNVKINTYCSFSVYSIDWIVAGLAAVPYLLFTDVNYIDQPMGSGNFLNESAFCALLDQNIYPKVKYIFM